MKNQTLYALRRKMNNFEIQGVQSFISQTFPRFSASLVCYADKAIHYDFENGVYSFAVYLIDNNLVFTLFNDDCENFNFTFRNNECHQLSEKFDVLQTFNEDMFFYNISKNFNCFNDVLKN